jgi:hypothetical protein
MRIVARPRIDIGAAALAVDPRVVEILRATVDCVSAVEHFTHARVRNIVDLHVEGLNDRVASNMYKKAKDIDSSWQSVRDAAREYLDFDIGKIVDSRRFFGFVDVRNAVMHGNGSLTKLQQRQGAEISQRIDAAGFSLIGLKIAPVAATALGVATSCRAFIIAIDNATWSSSEGLAKVLPPT